ncbi:POZ domain-containing protein [Rhizophagus irregularis]|uniref:POZ domain-containing protein n=1 Tax=Rhizophagus irregularis TaxID=588596 RepID=A0A2I1HHN6_9GLOM|nr:POZ domain-containing protein [Rhizophagus irregularis]
MADNKLLPKLLQNLLDILNDEEYYDITIEVGNDPYIKIFRAHMVILHYRSPYLRRILSTNKKKNDETLTHIKLPNISPEIFQIILRYIYGGNLSLNEYDNSVIIQTLIAANELSLQELILYLQSFLIENKANWMEQNFNLMYQTSFENDTFSELQKYCTDLMTKEPIKIFNSLNFSSIPEKLLITIIQNDNLQMSEIQVWEHILKWGHAQNPELPSDITNYSKDDFNTLKSTLQQFIPFIKFYNLTNKEFTDKVLPYREILSEELFINLLKTFLSLSDPNIKPSDNLKPFGNDPYIKIFRAHMEFKGNKQTGKENNSGKQRSKKQLERSGIPPSVLASLHDAALKHLCGKDSLIYPDQTPLSRISSRAFNELRESVPNLAPKQCLK